MTLSPADRALLEGAGLRVEGRELHRDRLRVGEISGDGEPATTGVRLDGRVWLPLGGRSAVERAVEAT